MPDVSGQQEQIVVPALAVSAIEDLLLATAPALVKIFEDYMRGGATAADVIGAIHDGEHAIVITGDGCGVFPVINAELLGDDRVPFIVWPK